MLVQRYISPIISSYWIFIYKEYFLFLQIGEVFQNTIEEIEDTFLNSKDPKDVKLREELSKNLPIKQENPILWLSQFQ